MTEAQAAPRVSEWQGVMDVLHAFANMITVRSHYTEGHPAIAQADEHAANGFVRVLEKLPELVVALVDGEFIVSERPLPDLRTRLHALADAMTRHEIECMVFQRGMTREECGILGRALVLPVGTRVREETQSELTHVLLRFVVRAGDTEAGGGVQSAFFVPAAHDLLVGLARSLAAEEPIDKLGIAALANQIVTACGAHSGIIHQRPWTRSMEDEATHAVNVATMTALLAHDAGYPQRVCIDATAGALVHDIGHLFLPEEIRGMPEPLLEERSRPVFRNHTFAGAQMLLAAGCAPLWVAAAYEHHRGMDGGGYPAVESTTPPHELVRMIALANYYDSKRTALNGNVEGTDPEAVLEGAMELEAKYFGPGLIRRFLKVLGVFPPGTTVELSTLEPAIVTRANGVDPWRPQVKILRGPNAGKFVEVREMDSRENRYRVSIVRAIPPPLMVLGDVVVAAPVVLPQVEVEEVPDFTEAKPAVSAEDGARDAAVRARAQLGGMGDMLDALLTVPTEALVSAMPAPPSASARPAPMQIPSYQPAPMVASLPPQTLSSAPPVASSAPPVASSAPPVASSAPPALREAEGALLQRLGSITAVPALVADAAKGGLDHRAGFLLTFVDGMSSVDDILDASGLPRVDALHILADLLTKGVIVVR
jgi:HD-GYP domain-containing protein (c-di-GMP phosphodiesterase class II)